VYCTSKMESFYTFAIVFLLDTTDVQYFIFLPFLWSLCHDTKITHSILMKKQPAD
jgi:hypothetical protein